MTETENAATTVASVDEVQKGWHELSLRVGQLEKERTSLEHENKALRFLLERVIEHRQKSHSELVLLLTSLVSKLPINDVGVLISRLVEHNAQVTETCGVLAKGKVDAGLPQPVALQALAQTKRDLAAALTPLIEELMRLEAPIEPAMLQSLVTQPDSFFSPPVVRATRCFIKGQVPRERVIREFGEAALGYFNDMTTDPKLNPRPKPDEVVLSFKNDFESLLQQDSSLPPEKRAALLDLFRRVQRSKASTPEAQAQRQAFQKVSFILELLHYYENQSTEAPDVVFAQRLPVLIESFVITNPQEPLDPKLIEQAEALLAFIINTDHRHSVINNIGKGGGAGRTLKFVLLLRDQKKLPIPDYIMHQVIPDFVKHLIPVQKPPAPASLVPVFKLLEPDLQRFLARAFLDTDRIRKDEAEALSRALARELDLKGLEEQIKAEVSVPPEIERQMAWEKIRELIVNRVDPATIATAVRDRLHAHYDPNEIKQSWITLTDADPISFIRVFCHLPYLADGTSDPVARAVMETYVSRLMHEKYAAAYSKVLNSLKNMFRANPHSPTLQNFVALVRWIDAAAASKLTSDIGMAVAA